MTRICKNCEFVNQDDYDFCAKCGTPLVEGLQPKNVIVFKNQAPPVNKKVIIVSYLLTIFLSWSGFIIGTFFKSTRFSIFTFFGFFLPFYLVQSRNPTVKKHGLIMIVISVVGVALSFYTLLQVS